MRALGFGKNHVLIFIVLQAFSFAIPGLLLGLVVALILNDSFREIVYYSSHSAGEYGLSKESILVSTILMGFLVPLISNIGPTREALSKSLRASLDASRRDGSGEAVSAFVTELQDVGISGQEIVTAIYLCTFGIVTYYFIPMALLTDNKGLFFLILNLVMTSLLLGLVFLVAIVLPACQRAILSCLLCMCKKDRPLWSIVRNRLESGRDRNTKIALMVTSSVCVILYQASGGLTVFAYFKDLWHWFMAGDIMLSYTFSSGLLNEVPMA